MVRKLQVYLGDQHEAWQKYAEANGWRPATLAAELLKLQLQQQNAALLPPKLPLKSDSRIQIRLRKDETALLDQFAQRMGRTRQQALAAIVRAALAAEPQFSLDEEKTLKQSIRKVDSIGVNINQIARRLNSPHFLELFRENGGNALDMLRQLTDSMQQLNLIIAKHSGYVWGIINAARHRLPLMSADAGRKVL